MSEPAPETPPRSGSLWTTALLHPALLALGATVAVVLALLFGMTETAPGGVWLLGLVAVLGLTALGLLVAVLLTRARLTERVRQMEAALDAAPQPRGLSDAAGRFLVMNRALRDLVGAPSLGASVDAIHRALAVDGAKIDTVLQDAAHGRVAVAEIQTGDPAWLSVAGYPAGAGAVFWQIDDITERWQAENRWRTEQAILADLLGNMPMGLFSVDQDGAFRAVNDIFAEWLGLDQGALTGSATRLHDLLADRAPDTLPAHDPFARRGREDHSLVRLKTSDGSVIETRIAQTLSAPVTGADGVQRFWTRAVVRRLSMKDDWEEALRRSEQRFQRIFEEAPLGIVLLNADGHIIATNQAFRIMVRPIDERVVGKKLDIFLHQEDRDSLAARLEEVEQGAAPALPLDVRVRGPKEILAALFASRSEDREGAPTGFIIHFLDLTEEKRLEAQFAHSQKMQAVGQLAGGVAHDFNNLLTAMTGNCDLLLTRHRPGEQSYMEIMQIKQSADRAAGLVKQLLAFSRQQPLRPRVLDVTDVLAEVTDLVRRLIGENIDLQMLHGRDLPRVRVDQGQLEQVILNLAVNARDAMIRDSGAGGLLTIRTMRRTVKWAIRRRGEEVSPGDYVVIEVADTGHGVPDDVIDRIFDPFFSTKKKGEGTGLGLSTVYGIVKQTGGVVFVDSKDSGASFTIYLPALSAAEAEAAHSEEEKPRERRIGDLTGTGTVILVEDEDPVRLFSARALRGKGYRVLEARSGKDALSLIEDNGEKFDVLITDVVMPQMDGPELIRCLRDRKLAQDFKVIFISGYAEDSFRERLGEDTEIHFLPKPFSLKQLAGKVKDVMAA